MTEFEITDPVWQYESEENALVEIDNLHLIVWQHGFCVTGFDGNGKPLKIKTFLFREYWDVPLMQQLFENDPLFAGPQPIRQIWIAEARNILIPESLYEETQASEWLGKFHFLEAGEELVHVNMQPHQEARMVFPIKQTLRDLFGQYFPEAAVSALSRICMISEPDSSGTILEIINLPKMVLLSLRERERLIVHQLYPYEQTENVVYKIALILEEQGIAQEQIQATLSGIAPFWNNLNIELPHFFKSMPQLEDTTQVSLTFLNKLFSCV